MEALNWGVNTTAGQPILAGETPEPGTQAMALLAAGAAALRGAATSLNLLSASLAALLLAGIRNAWDMMVWIVIKTPSGGVPRP